MPRPLLAGESAPRHDQMRTISYLPSTETTLCFRSPPVGGGELLLDGNTSTCTVTVSETKGGETIGGETCGRALLWRSRGLRVLRASAFTCKDVARETESVKSLRPLGSLLVVGA
jgi:hypothetical protein